MFEQSLLDSARRIKTRKPATIAISLLVQTVAVAALMLLPLVYTQALPQRILTSLLMMPPAPAARPPASPPSTTRVHVAVRRQVPFEQPRIIPRDVPMLREDPAPPSGFVGEVGDQSVMVAGRPDTLLTSPIEMPAPPPAPAQPELVRLSSGVMAAKLVSQAKPLYPEIAIRARIQGTVRLAAIISKQGTIQNLTLISGHPLLVAAALDAVRQWRYEPTLLSGTPVEVETTVEVHFKLNN